MKAAGELAQRKGGHLVAFKNKGKSTWRCGEGHTFAITIGRVKRGRWCPTCGSSVGERRIREFFRAYQIPFIPQAVIPVLPTRRYDYYFEWNGKRYIVEFDGEQHFRFVRKYHKAKGNFYQAQAIDRVKTYIGLQSGCHVIRVDYTQRETVAWHIVTAVNLDSPLYLSNFELYSYIIKTPVTYSELQQYAPQLFSSH